MKTLVLRFKSNQQMRAVLGALWDAGLDPDLDDEQIDEQAPEIMASICKRLIIEKRALAVLRPVDEKITVVNGVVTGRSIEPIRCGGPADAKKKD